MRTVPVLAVLLAVAGATVAQSPAQYAAQIPSCALQCDNAGIEKAGCDLTDYACHCSHSDAIKSYVLPCLSNSSTCTAADLTKFGTLVGEICAALNTTNSTTPANSTASSSGTGSSVTPTTSSTLVPYTGAAAGTTVSTAFLLAAFSFVGLSL